MTIREPLVDVLGSGMPACGHRMTTWSEVIGLCGDLMVTWGSLAASRERCVVIAGSGGFASPHTMLGRYEGIVIRSELIAITSEGIAIRSRLRPTARRDAATWSSVVFGGSVVVDVRYDVVATARDVMTI
jgi:hypothetical protein